MAELPLPYDQLSLMLKLVELGINPQNEREWEDVLFKFPAGCSSNPMSSPDYSARSFWLCTGHITVRKQLALSWAYGRDAVLAIASRDIHKTERWAIIDVRLSDGGKTLCEECRLRAR